MTPIPFKTLHSFTVSLDQQVTETTTRDEGGQSVTITKQVTKAVPHTILMKEPGRKERQDLAMFQSVVYNEAISKGLLPKVVMQQKVGQNADTPLSQDEDKNIAEMNRRLQEMANDHIRLSALSTSTEEDKARKERLAIEYLALRKKVEDIETAYQSIYAYTAESYMQIKTLSWLNVFLTYVQPPEGKPEPMFAGADFAAREARAGEMEDSEDPLYKAALEKLPTYWMLYLFNRANKPEDFARIEGEWRKQTEAAAKIKEDAEKLEATKVAQGGLVTDASTEPVPALVHSNSVMSPEAVANVGTATLEAVNAQPVVA